jgi:hypothetical protein
MNLCVHREGAKRLVVYVSLCTGLHETHARFIQYLCKRVVQYNVCIFMTAMSVDCRPMAICLGFSNNVDVPFSSLHCQF